MNEWLKLDPAVFNTSKHESVGGADIEVFLSPYDVPEAVRAVNDSENNHFIVEFKYIGGDEPVETEAPDHQVTFKIGKHSKRLYAIYIDTATLTPDKPFVLNFLLPEVSEALHKLADNPETARRSGNYTVAQEILTERMSDLFFPPSLAAI